MKTTERIVNFPFHQIFILHSFPRDIKNQIDNQLDIVEKINSNLGNIENPKVPNTITVENVIEKYNSIRNHSAPIWDVFTKREVKLLTYGIWIRKGIQESIICNTPLISTFLDDLNSKWNDRYIFGLFYSFLNSWNHANSESLKLLSSFIISKVNIYCGKNKRIISIRENSKYWDINNGDLIFGKEAALESRRIKEKMSSLSLDYEYLHSSYFSGVILSYYYTISKNVANVRIDFIQELEELLRIHNNGIVSKNIISDIVIKSKSLYYMKEKVKKLALNIIGDPGVQSNWHPSNVAEEDKNKIIKARKIVNQWLINSFIEVFFSVAIDDFRRKKFWLKYAGKIEEFKIIGPSNIYYKLLQDERIGEFVDMRYQKTSKAPFDISAFVMIIGEYHLVEFSVINNSFYAYHETSEFVPNFNKLYASTKQLKMTNLPTLDCYNRVITNETGRFIHSDLAWEDRLAYWLKYRVGVEPDD
jgi:hypothetical protein